MNIFIEGIDGMDTQVIRCGKCGAGISVPRNMGLVRIVCPFCRNEFLFNSGPALTYGPGYPPGPAAPGMTAPRPPEVPPKKRGGRKAVFAVLALLLVVSIGAFAVKNMETLSAWISSAGGQASDAAGPPVQQTSTYERAGELIPYFESRYFLSRLDETELDVICTLYENAMNYEETCTFEKRVEKSKFNQLFCLLAVECPELFQLDYESGNLCFYDAVTQEVTSCQLTYLIADQREYEEMRRSCEAVISGFAAETRGLSDYEKEKYVFDYIASNCWYNVGAAYAGIPYGALVSFEAKCDGFSGAMKWSMEALGIQCLTVSGDPADGGIGHAWNVIRLDGSYYVLDVTASAHDDWQVEAGIGRSEIVYRAFNVSDAMNARYEIRGFYAAFAPIPECSRMDASYYARTGRFVPAGADPSGVLSRELESLAANGGAAYIQFERAEDYEAFCDGAGERMIENWLSGCGKHWNRYTWWRLGYNVYMVRVEW